MAPVVSYLRRLNTRTSILTVPFVSKKHYTISHAEVSEECQVFLKWLSPPPFSQYSYIWGVWVDETELKCIRNTFTIPLMRSQHAYIYNGIT